MPLDKFTKGLANHFGSGSKETGVVGPGSEPSEPQAKEANPRPGSEFEAFVEEKKCIGRDGNGSIAHYIPKLELEQYWRNRKIEEMRKAYTPPLSIGLDAIRKRSLQIFSILVYTNNAQFIGVFLRSGIYDEQLPFSERPSQLCGPFYEGLWTNFVQHQWLFCPLVLDPSRLHDRRLEPQHVLPFSDEKVLRGSRLSEVFKIRIHEACIDLDQTKAKPKDDVFVLKRYINDGQRSFYANEIGTLSLLHSHKVMHIVGFYGSFVQAGKFNMILQYVDGGTLLDFYKTAEPPTSPEQISQLWKSLFKVFEGLHQIHSLMKSNPSHQDPDCSTEYRGIHQDIKPDNILLATGTSGSSYDFSPILADFGHTHIRVVPYNVEDGLGVDKRGNQIYCAPESSHHAKYTRMVPNHITSQADIFSMGCVISEAAVWIVHGIGGLCEYMDLREAETNGLEHFRETDTSGCFHDGVERLKAVGTMHGRVREACQPDDLMTRGVLDLVEEHMLLPKPEDRRPAKDLRDRFCNIKRNKSKVGIAEVATAFRKMSSQAKEKFRALSNETVPSLISGSSADSDRAPSSPQSPDQPLGHASDLTAGFPPMTPQRPKINPLQPVHDQPADRRHSEPFTTLKGEDDPQSSDPSLLSPASAGQRHSVSVPAGELHTTGSAASSQSSLVSPHGENLYFTIEKASEWRHNWKGQERFDNDVHNIVRRLQKNLRGRHHLFFVDNSGSMAQHKEEVARAFQELSYVVKHRREWYESSPSAQKQRKGPAPSTFELRFASDVMEGVAGVDAGTTATSPFVEKLAGCRYDFLSGLMEERFGWLVDNIVIPGLALAEQSPGEQEEQVQGSQRKRGLSFKKSEADTTPMRKDPMSIVVFTDGRWGKAGAESGVGIQNPIKRLIDRIKSDKVARTHVMIQFVRFGDDANGISNLKYLVDFAKSEGCHIVDTQPVSGNIVSMLTGSITQNNES